jgi:hypothetical protein
LENKVYPLYQANLIQTTKKSQLPNYHSNILSADLQNHDSGENTGDESDNAGLSMRCTAADEKRCLNWGGSRWGSRGCDSSCLWWWWWDTGFRARLEGSLFRRLVGRLVSRLVHRLNVYGLNVYRLDGRLVSVLVGRLVHRLDMYRLLGRLVSRLLVGGLLGRLVGGLLVGWLLGRLVGGLLGGLVGRLLGGLVGRLLRGLMRWLVITWRI